MAPATTASRKRTSTPPPKDKTKAASSKVDQENRKKAVNRSKAVESHEPQKLQYAQASTLAQASTSTVTQAMVVVAPTKLAVIGHTAWALAQWILAGAVIFLGYKCVVNFSSLLERLAPLRTFVSTWASNFSEYIAVVASDVGPVVIDWWHRICEGSLTDVVSEVTELSPMKLGCVLASLGCILAVVTLSGLVVVRGMTRACLKRGTKVE